MQATRVKKYANKLTFNYSAFRNRIKLTNRVDFKQSLNRLFRIKSSEKCIKTT